MSGPSVFPSSSNMSVNGGTWNAVGGNQYNYNVHTATFSQNFRRTLSTPSSSPLSSPEVYAQQLLLTGNGYPLWVPEPLSNCSVYRSKGVRIGDVGYVDRDSGAFAPLFNIRAQPDDCINRLGVPEGFETVEFDTNDIVSIPEYHRPNCAVTSKPQIVDALKSRSLSETDSGVAKYTWATQDGAILHLPSGSTRRNARPGTWREYALRHAIDWYKFTHTKGWDLPNDSLYLITGSDKSHSWGVGAFSGALDIAGTGISVQLRTVMKNGIPFSDFVATSHPIDFRVGPDGPSIPQKSSDPSSIARNDSRSLIDRDDAIFACDAPFGRNQCIFVRGWRIKVRKDRLFSRIMDFPPRVTLWKNVFSPRRSTMSSDSVLEELQSRILPFSAFSQLLSKNIPDPCPIPQNYVDPSDSPYHPLDVINSCLLNQFPTARMAITHDDDWCSLVEPDDQVFPDKDELIARLIAKFDLKMDPASGGAYIEPKKSRVPLPKDRRVDSWVGPSGSASSAASTAFPDTLELQGPVQSDTQSTPQDYSSDLAPTTYHGRNLFRISAARSSRLHSQLPYAHNSERYLIADRDSSGRDDELYDYASMSTTLNPTEARNTTDQTVIESHPLDQRGVRTPTMLFPCLEPGCSATFIPLQELSHHFSTHTDSEQL